jgi:hypothetical protein
MASYVKSFLEDLIAKCEALEVPITTKRMKTLHFLVGTHDAGVSLEVTKYIQGIEHVFREELESKRFFVVPPLRYGLYEDSEPFGVEVHQNFPKARIDISEAAKCFALARWTACVFHLTRVLERGLVALAGATNASIDHKNNNWNGIIQSIDAALKAARAPSSPSTPESKKLQEAYESASAHFYVIRGGWRNPTSHAETVYAEEEALRIYNSSRAFMQDLAKILREAP